jgi:hypothetical protein
MLSAETAFGVTQARLEPHERRLSKISNFQQTDQEMAKFT